MRIRKDPQPGRCEAEVLVECYDHRQCSRNGVEWESFGGGEHLFCQYHARKAREHELAGDARSRRRKG